MKNINSNCTRNKEQKRGTLELMDTHAGNITSHWKIEMNSPNNMYELSSNNNSPANN